jgi:hypothetical protein
MAYNDLGFEKQGAGTNLNTWGDPHLNNTIDRARYAISGYVAVALTGDYTLTSSNTSTAPADFEARNALLKFTGTLTVNATVTVSGVPHRWLMWNATNKVLTITTGSGSTVTLDSGDKVVVWCDGTNVEQPGYAGYGLKDYIASMTATAGAVPGVTGNAGKYLYTDGVSALWRQPSTADLSDYARLVLGVQVALAVAL